MLAVSSSLSSTPVSFQSSSRPASNSDFLYEFDSILPSIERFTSHLYLKARCKFKSVVKFAVFVICQRLAKLWLRILYRASRTCFNSRKLTTSTRIFSNKRGSLHKASMSRKVAQSLILRVFNLFWNKGQNTKKITFYCLAYYFREKRKLCRYYCYTLLENFSWCCSFVYSLRFSYRHNLISWLFRMNFLKNLFYFTRRFDYNLVPCASV